MDKRWVRGAIYVSALSAGCVKRSPDAERQTQVATAEPKLAARQPRDPSAAPASVAADPSLRLTKLRAALRTQITVGTDHTPAPTPPPHVFEKVYYPAPLGKNVAYVSPVKPGAKRPGMVWIAGGLIWGIAEDSWEPAPRQNDQSARAFREAGIALMRPALRGSNENPGHNECFLGEVDDVLAAADFLARRPDVDPERLYLGGHSTGAVMALLVVESTRRFRAAFAFGPVADIRQYGERGCLPSSAPIDEAAPRVPALFLSEITTPTLIIEGEHGNAQAFPSFRKAKGSAPVELLLIPGADHFSALATASEELARQILADTGPATNLRLDVDAVARRAPAPAPAPAPH